MKPDIPNKILIGRGVDGKIRHSYWTTDQELTPFDDTVFVRMDALLEWAKENIDSLGRLSYGEFIDKLNNF